MRELRSPWGWVRVGRESPQLVTVEAEGEGGAAFGQGFAAGRLRLWQLELTRRVAAGTTAALFGPAALASDRFQRNLGLVALAEREAARDAASPQAELVAAYVAGINHAVARARLPPLELMLLGHRPRRFEVVDVYLVAQLKYFINSTWKFEVLHTLVAGALGPARAWALFATPVLEGGERAALPREATGQLTAAAAEALAAGLDGLDRLGLASPDIGSNAFAVAGARTRSGAPLLATDPHMGLVNPGFNLLVRVTTGDGLRLVGSHFPGVPGIVVGCNQHVAWGMVGLMADNQDLLWGQLDEARAQVRVAGQWLPLSSERSRIEVRGGAAEPHVAQGFARGRLVHAAGDRGLFLRWPALDRPLGSIALGELARASDWPSFRRGLAAMQNAPMIAVYADRKGDLGLQAVGLIPERAAAVGSLVQSLDRPEAEWRGYVAFDALPTRHQPSGGAIVYANQYEAALFDGAPHLSNRWHPPTRARRIGELLDARPHHDAASFAAIQDDRVDGLARDRLPGLLQRLGAADDRGLRGWAGDTRDTRPALLFERWLDELARAVVGAALPPALAAAYPDQWPAYRWSVLAILERSPAEWGIDDPGALLAATLARAAVPAPAPRVAYRHALRGHPLGRLFALSHAYDGGGRETIHVARRNLDFLSSRQAGARAGATTAPYSFGPAFKLIYDLGPGGAVHYAANVPSSGLALGPVLQPALRRWRQGRRYRAELP